MKHHFNRAKKQGFKYNLGILTFGFIFFAHLSCLAATFTVTRNDDRNATCSSGVDCSLREAINAANESASNDTISFSQLLTSITLTNEILIANNGSLVINGLGADILTVDGGAGTNRIFTSNAPTITIKGLSLTGGNGNSDGSGFGGAIFVNVGNITLDGVYFFGNTAPGGGQGGAISTQSGTNTIIRNSTFYNNTTQSCGAISIRGSLEMSNSTISGNTATLSGGGLCVINSPNTVKLRNVSIVNNISQSRGGGIYILGVSSGSSINVGNSIVAGNSAPMNPEIYVQSTGPNVSVNSAGYNLIGDSNGDAADTGISITYQTTDKLDIPPKLGPLSNNGGTTPTHFLQLDSPAIDTGGNNIAIDPSTGLLLVSDQTGSSRIMDGNHDGIVTVDIGAFELPTCFHSINPISQDFSSSGGAGSIQITVQNGCEWTAQSNVPWIVVTQGNSGSGSGTAMFSVQPSSETRTGTISLGGRVFTVNQISLTVTNSDDSGNGSLRQAIMYANNSPTDDVIEFDPSLTGAITLTSGELQIKNAGTLQINASNLLVIKRSEVEGTPEFRILNIDAGSVVSINNLQISGGLLTIGNTVGGGIYNNGTLNLNDVKVSNNSIRNGNGGGTVSGGGVYNTGTLSMTNCIIENNGISSIGSFIGGVSAGGGISNTGNLSITNTVVRNNSSFSNNGLTNPGTAYGGGLYGSGIIINSVFSGNFINARTCYGGAIYGGGTIFDSTIVGNSASSNSNNGDCRGGGIYGGGEITRSTISGNSVSGGAFASDGGGIYGYGNITNSTITNNRANVFTLNGSVARGGGIYGGGVLKNVTIAGNSITNFMGGTSSGGAGIYGSGTFINTIVANNIGTLSPNVSGTVSSEGNNIIGNANGSSGWTANDLLNVNPQLGTLGNYGGLTQTIPLLSNSPAINAGNNVNAPATDQRGFVRIANGIIDIGAFEYRSIQIGCSYSLGSTNQSFPASGGNGSLNINTSSSCFWEAQSNDSWITVTNSNGTGNGTIQLTVQPNSGAARSGTIWVSGQIFTINQASGCSYSITPTNINVTSGGENGTMNVITGAGCSWTAVSNDSWITVTNGSIGSGNGSVGFTVAANSGVARTGTLTIAGQTFTVNQANGCNFTINPTSQDFASQGGNSGFALTSSDTSCSWNALASDNWITITSNTSGSGSSIINFTVGANNGASRSASITVGGQTFTINQGGNCSYSISPTSVNVPSNGEFGVVNVTTGTDCNWTATTNDNWITITNGSSGSGNGSVSFTVQANTGIARTGTLTIAGQTLTINQADGCTISLSLTSANFQANGGNGIFGINTQSGCMWSAATSDSWININQSSGTGIGKVAFTVASNSGLARIGTIRVNGQTFTVTQEARPVSKAAFDLDGDGKSDVGIFRPSVGEWWYLRSSDGGNRAFQFGQSTDKIVAADYTGDGKTDIAFFRPSSGEWFILRSEDSSFYAFLFGNSEDIPTPADFDGDGKTDPAIYRPSNQTWYIIRSSDNQTTIRQFGAPGDLPVAADYDGDSMADLAIYRPSSGQWWVNRTQAGLIVATFGTSSDKTVQADYTGDGKADIAFFRPSSGEWFVLRSENFSFYSAPFGTVGDFPTPGDYDGDGKSDLAIFRPSINTWYLQQSTSGFTAITFGTTNDIPIHSAFVR